MSKRNPFSKRAGANDMLKAERFRLARGLKAALESMDTCTRLYERAYQWRLQTSVGFLDVSYSVDYGTIFTQFSDPNAALAYVACNPYSGKFNFHHGRISAADALESFLASLARIPAGGPDVEVTPNTRYDVSFTCRDNGDGAPETGSFYGEWNGQIDTWGKLTFETPHGMKIYLFRDEIESADAV